MPTFVIWNFANLFLIPKLEQLWRDTNLSAKASWLLDGTHLLVQGVPVAILGVALILFVLELLGRLRHRRVIVAIFVIFIHTAVLFALTAIATSVLLAAPVLLNQRDSGPKVSGPEAVK